ncbi:hypothetical protein NA57DRAFT_44453 [Rhizodiscina lignyota]|uniref:ABM domain-containing protein n=1 Tax=Rhizodiscina lignyota TaxID=1504668 RepID=A0A9P4I9X6_9PEZI|nr:hypothetical protein NA57DRAFT_44453 [Rhizodiscina lignyota]
MTVAIVAVISPAAGKVDRVQELLSAHAEYVKQNESGTLKYHLHKQIGSKTPDLVMIEEYTDKSAIGVHGAAPKFKEMGRTLKKEGLLAKPMDVKILEAVGGFASKL